MLKVLPSLFTICVLRFMVCFTFPYSKVKIYVWFILGYVNSSLDCFGVDWNAVGITLSSISSVTLYSIFTLNNLVVVN